MEYIQYEEKGKIAEIILNRPDSYNALNEQMLRELENACIMAAESDALIVLLRGEGRGFSAGGDIQMMTSAHDAGQYERLMKMIESITLTLYDMKKIVIAAIHGAAAGLGLSFALCADVVLAEQNARLAMNFIGIGLVPDGGGHYLLMRRVGEMEAKKLIWSGEKLPAEEAVRKKLADGLFSGDPKTGAKPYIDRLLNAPLSAMIETKAIYNSLHMNRLKDVLSLERKAQENMRKTDDHKEGIRAFLEKRTPQFNR
ncbi:enoyl-CoA hydratase [Bacillus sp. YC2]|uniref:enoyl-CoA hydratase n=1 Tax=Bacillus sp. YC2 TaxID=2861287 RepID=UPI001CA68474|nr:enoyl-CoA hydratase [Bacillus sp. YC2]MBY8912630.1 enoyl-CoA hydratase [Bacillus sp. YC2]